MIKGTIEREMTESCSSDHSFLLDQFRILFPLTVTPSSTNVSSLDDGILLFSALSEISPTYFDTATLLTPNNHVDDENGHDDTYQPNNCNTNHHQNWALKLSNLRKFYRNVEDYLRDELGKKLILSSTNKDELLSSIAKDQNEPGVLFLLELVMAIAVSCPDRATYVNRIMSMSTDHQVQMKNMIQRGLANLQDLEEQDEGDEEEYDNEEQGEEDDDGNDVETKNNSDDDAESNDKGTIADKVQFITTDAHRRNHSIDISYDEEGYIPEEMSGLFRDAMDKITLGDLDEYTSLTKSELFQQREVLRQQLEDVRKEFANFKSQTELFHQNTDYAQKKLRALTEDLQDRLSKREDELTSLETDLTRTRRLLEDAEVRASDYAEKNAILADELDVANAKASQLLKAEATVVAYRKKLEGVGLMNQQMSDLEDQAAKYLRQIVELEMETKKVPELMKSIDELQRDLARAEKEKMNAVESLNDKVTNLQTLKTTLTATEKAKKMYEDELKDLRSQHDQQEEVAGGTEFDSLLSLGARKSNASPEIIARLEQENNHLRQKLFEEQRRVGEGSILLPNGNTVTTSEVEILYDELMQLRELIDTKEQEKQKILSDKEKLEAYTKSTLAKFQNKYLVALQECKTKLKEKHDKNEALELRMASEKAAQKREEKLMSATVYELGLAILQEQLKQRY